MAQVLPPVPFDAHVPTLIIGAGAAGLVAALAATEAGQDVLVLERDAVPSGSTALSAGLIPGAGTRWQRAAGIDDDPTRFAADIQKKANHENDPAFVHLMAGNAGPTLEWLHDHYGLPFSVVTDFDYPGHSRRRMHGLPDRSGRALVDALRAAAEGAGVTILTEAQVDTLFADNARIHGVGLSRPDGTREQIGCDRLILACNGFGGNQALVARHMPEVAGALYFGHPGNQGEALDWGTALRAKIRFEGAYQGHGNVAHPHGILITWAVIAAGGFQINLSGRRFWNESQGYSEAARAVQAQPDGVAVAVFDARIADIARQFTDFRLAETQGAIRSAATPKELAQLFDLPAATVVQTCEQVRAAKAGIVTDPFGRDFAGLPDLNPPYLGVRVTAALFHTQGGLVVDDQARVCRASGGVIDNLFAAGGAACGVSGRKDAGYLSGNGLLSAITLGRLAGGFGSNPV